MSEIDQKLVELEFKNDFSAKELEAFRTMFNKFDENRSGELELFELNIMYEAMKEPKTNLQLRQLIQEADTNHTGGIDYREFLVVLLKDKKGQTKGPFQGLAMAVGKIHDDTKDTGKKANFFEQEIAKQRGDPMAEERARLEREAKKKAQEEKERKARIQRGLEKLKSGINSQ